MSYIFRIIVKSIKFYKKPVLYQVLITVLLSAVITGSLLTGRSVKESLKKSSLEHLGNSGIIISSGIRYIDPELGKRMTDSAGIVCTGILELNGYCQGFNSQKMAFNTHIYGINKDFFNFHGDDIIDIKPGEVAVNKRLADYLGIKPGDDLIIRFKEISDIPSDAPFAASGNNVKSIVMKVVTILEPAHNGNFSLSINQISPMNIFLNLTDLEDVQAGPFKINRLLVKRNIDNSLNTVSESLKRNLKPADIGLRIRLIKKLNEYELISDRIFLDEAMIKEIGTLLPSFPVITYLGNRFESGTRSTPYSFVSGLPSSLYPEIASENGIIINKWMAEDLSLVAGDTLQMYWYSPDSLSKLAEKRSHFIVKSIVDIKGVWSDSLLMPVFPGISGKTSCSDWDMGVPIKMHDIRSKDEVYWNRYRGTPKAFIGYEKGRELWGNNFGPATTIRFPAGVTDSEIKDKLAGSLDPSVSGLNITDLWGESVKAAAESVDFSTLFLSLGFFLILASMVLLSFAASSYFESKTVHINTLFALGFKNSRITQLLLIETGLIALTGCASGAFTGYLVNIYITMALNTVWNGAVQTDTLKSYFNLLTVFSGFFLTFLMIILFMLFKVRRYLKTLNQHGRLLYRTPSSSGNIIFFLASILVTISFFVISVLNKDEQSIYSFLSGTLLLISLVLLWRQHYIGSSTNGANGLKKRKQLSKVYYSFSPSNAITPILFIAAGIFTVFITSANRMNHSEKEMKRSGGTGGYLLWCENAIPVKEDINTESGRKSLGLDNDLISQMSFVQIKRSSGNDASCLNLNHIKTPPLLGIDPADFILKKSFSFSTVIAAKSVKNPWDYLNLSSENYTIYGIADQTVLEWGLKVKTGDTLILRSENGHPLNIIIAAGLQTSVFQGNVLIGKNNFTKYYPSVAGSSVLLVDGNNAHTELYKNTLNERLANYGSDIEKTTDRLASFNKVTNTYLSVFALFGAMGMIIGVAGLGFVLLRNFNKRKPEFALMLATGFSIKSIRKMILSEQTKILLAGVSTGILSALVATWPSLRNKTGIPWLFLIVMILLIFMTGLIVLVISLRSVTDKSLVASLKKE